jgi:hypothetical protein
MAKRDIFLLSLTAIIAALAATCIGRELRKRFGCYDNLEQTVTGPADLDVQVIDELCDSEMELVYVTSSRSGRRVLIFSYYRTPPSPMIRREDVPPTIRWLDSTHLLVSIDVVDQVTRQRYDVEGVQVGYRIGRILYPRS